MGFLQDDYTEDIAINGSLHVDNIVIDSNTIGLDIDTDLITLADESLIITGALGFDSLSSAIDMDSQLLTNINIDSGTIDNTIIGGDIPALGTFSTITSSSMFNTSIADEEIVHSANNRLEGDPDFTWDGDTFTVNTTIGASDNASGSITTPGDISCRKGVLKDSLLIRDYPGTLESYINSTGGHIYTGGTQNEQLLTNGYGLEIHNKYAGIMTGSFSYAPMPGMNPGVSLLLSSQYSGQSNTVNDNILQFLTDGSKTNYYEGRNRIQFGNQAAGGEGTPSSPFTTQFVEFHMTHSPFYHTLSIGSLGLNEILIKPTATIGGDDINLTQINNHIALSNSGGKHTSFGGDSYLNGGLSDGPGMLYTNTSGHERFEMVSLPGSGSTDGFDVRNMSSSFSSQGDDNLSDNYVVSIEQQDSTGAGIPLRIRNAVLQAQSDADPSENKGFLLELTTNTIGSTWSNGWGSIMGPTNFLEKQHLSDFTWDDMKSTTYGGDGNNSAIPEGFMYMARIKIDNNGTERNAWIPIWTTDETS